MTEPIDDINDIVGQPEKNFSILLFRKQIFVENYMTMVMMACYLNWINFLKD